MSAFLLDYLPMIILFGIATALSIAFLLVPALIAPKDGDTEKLSTYECGFNAFDDSRMKFDVRFYLVAILFIIFDIEVAFLFPLAVTLDQVTFWAWFVFIIFIAELAAGLAYAWKMGALDWE